MTWPVVQTITAGVVNAVAKFNSHSDAINYLYNPAEGTYTQDTAQSLATATWTTINFQTAPYDNYADWIDSHRYSISEPGMYVVKATLAFDPNATGSRGGRIAYNDGTTRYMHGRTMVNAVTEGSRNTEIVVAPQEQNFSAGTTIWLEAFQTSGGALSTTVAASSGIRCTLTIRKVGNGQ